jgi:hypothetical protein
VLPALLLRLLHQGSFEFEPLQSAWEVQRHIRRHGAVITRFNMDPGFEPFYADAARRGQVYVRKGPAPAPGAGQSTAVLLVGYNLDTQTWKVRHSWGQDFADNGYFRVRGGGWGGHGEWWGVGRVGTGRPL